MSLIVFFFFQAEDGIRDADVTGVQTCALPILPKLPSLKPRKWPPLAPRFCIRQRYCRRSERKSRCLLVAAEIGRASCRERVEISVGVVSLIMKLLRNVDGRCLCLEAVRVCTCR